MGVVFLSVASSIMAEKLLTRSSDGHSLGGVRGGVTARTAGRKRHTSRRVGGDESSTRASGLRGERLSLAFAIAIAAALGLVAVALIGRSDSSAPPTATPVVDLSGIPQDGSVLGSPDATVTLIEWADAQCPACRFYTEEFFPTVVDEYVRPGTHQHGVPRLPVHR